MNKLLIVSVIATTALLAGCSTNTELENKVDALTNQVDAVAAEHQMIKSDHEMMKANAEAAAAADSEAERANARIDNMVESYKK